ncbi:formylglycine-generating enzyme family protein [Salinispora arenicola]|uniref:formylglycine-generating enzyme family protein n=1 Tax=Salinispora arenicola TaxID=168697 RepID=UPI00037EA1C5|nr:formylglycine-generating enzyme family protein [Salinispora arenicola]MCN0178373.1 formylglycine-generating enzyme family protein [Salinispora arenicola]
MQCVVHEALGSPATTSPARDMVWIPGGRFRMGSNDFYPEEGPARWVEVDGFWIDQYQVTVADFDRFVRDTGHVTMAEVPPEAADYPDADPDLLVPGSLVFRKAPGPVSLADYRNWWSWTPGATWRHPEGPGSTIEGRDLHPVTHVAYSDAVAFATWAGKELPTESEWELAARGGLADAVFTWGDEFAPEGRMMANTWQGAFPWQNLLLDGYAGTSPVGAFPPNGYSLYDMAGNVWEWTRDVFTYPAGPSAKACCTTPVTTDEPGSAIPRHVIKGGSHLCAPNYCMRYRPAARQGEAIDTSTCHLGFRCVIR